MKNINDALSARAKALAGPGSSSTAEGNDKEESSKQYSEGESTKELVEWWAKISFVRVGLILSGTVCGTWAALGL